MTTPTDGLVHIQECNLSHAWAGAFKHVRDTRSNSILVVSIVVEHEGFIQEDSRIRSLLDEALRARGKELCHTVANTIFPVSLWNPANDRQQLFKRYEKIWPLIKEHPRNRLGAYFRRLTAFESERGRVNQLEFVIDTWNREIRRRSALQASLIDPGRDLVPTPYRGFPCLQQVSFTPIGPKGREGLEVTGLYPTQYLFDKAYGNYLGLCRLGCFMAQEMGLYLRRVNCITIHPLIGNNGRTKGDLRPLQKAVELVMSAALLLDETVA